MAALSNFLENKLIDFLFRAQALGITGASAAAGTGPTSLWVGLYTANPTDVAGGTEVTGGSYARVQVTSALTAWAGTQAPASTVASTGTGGTTSNNAAITFPAPSANWGSITGFGLFDAVTAGNLLIYGAITPNKTVNNGDAAPAFSAAQLSIQLDD